MKNEEGIAKLRRIILSAFADLLRFCANPLLSRVCGFAQKTKSPRNFLKTDVGANFATPSEYNDYLEKDNFQLFLSLFDKWIYDGPQTECGILNFLEFYTLITKRGELTIIVNIGTLERTMNIIILRGEVTAHQIEVKPESLDVKRSPSHVEMDVNLESSQLDKQLRSESHLFCLGWFDWDYIEIIDIKSKVIEFGKQNPDAPIRCTLSLTGTPIVKVDTQYRSERFSEFVTIRK